MSKHFFQFTGVALILLILQACSAGGGETGTGETTQDTSTAVSVGVITGFGSVFVNGVEYETSSNTTISVDENTNALESQLAVGMLVTIAGSVNADGTTGLASSITFEDNVEGTVIDNTLSTGGALNVLGQSVYVDNDTIFDNKSGDATVLTVEDIKLGQVVEVSGYGNGDGNIYATRIELKSIEHKAGETIEVKGLAKAVTGSQFKIGEMLISYTSDVLKDFDATLQENDFVKVKTTQAVVNGLMIADKIELAKAHDKLENGFTLKEVEYEGVITATDLVNNSFTLNTQAVSFNEQTKFENGSETDLAASVRLKIEGKVNESGVIEAREIKFKQVSYTRLEGVIESVNTADNTIVVPGYTIKIDSQTRLKDDLEDESITEQQRQFFNFSSLKVGDLVEISAYQDANNQWVASKLERKTPEGNSEPDNSNSTTEWELKGVITDVSGNVLIVKNISVDFSNVSGILPVVGNIVEMHGIIENDVWMATEIEIKEVEQKPTEDDPEDASEEDDDPSIF